MVQVYKRSIIGMKQYFCDCHFTDCDCNVGYVELADYKKLNQKHNKLLNKSVDKCDQSFSFEQKNFLIKKIIKSKETCAIKVNNDEMTYLLESILR